MRKKKNTVKSLTGAPTIKPLLSILLSFLEGDFFKFQIKIFPNPQYILKHQHVFKECTAQMLIYSITTYISPKKYLNFYFSKMLHSLGLHTFLRNY